MNNVESINQLIVDSKVDTNLISDGYHTFQELYEHRINLFIALCRNFSHGSWKSLKHSDGSVMEGWFIMGIYKNAGNQITYHLPMSRWNETHDIVEFKCAPVYDGHTSADVLERLLKF